MVSDEFASIVMRLEVVVVNVLGSIVTLSPLATSIVPLLVNVAAEMSSAPVALALIVPLLVKAFPATYMVPPPVWLMTP